MLIDRKNLLILFLSVCAFTALYLLYVKQDRQHSITKYFPDPKIGDIYKIRKETSEDGVFVFYLKIKDIGGQSIYFYQGKMQSGAITDVFLNHYDTVNTTVYSKKELAEIVAGKWMIADKDKTQLLEIERK